MNTEELIADLRARVNPQYYDQIGTESYERHQCVMAIESLLARNGVLREENERQRFDILAMNQSLEMIREENERLRKDAERYRWLSDDGGIHSLPYDDFGCGPVFDLSRDAIDAARRVGK